MSVHDEVQWKNRAEYERAMDAEYRRLTLDMMCELVRAITLVGQSLQNASPNYERDIDKALKDTYENANAISSTWYEWVDDGEPEGLDDEE